MDNGMLIPLLIDLGVLLGIGLSVFIGVKRGFVLTLLPLASIVLAVVLGMALRGPVRQVLDKTPLESKINASVTALLEKGVGKYEEAALDLAGKKDELESQLTSIPDYISNAIHNWMDELESDTKAADNEFVTNSAAKITSTVMDLIAFVLIALVVWVIIIIIRIIVKATRELNIPVLHQLDSVGGGILGFLFAALVIYGVLLLIGIMAASGTWVNLANYISSSKLAGFMYNYNAIGIFVEWLKS